MQHHAPCPPRCSFQQECPKPSFLSRCHQQVLGVMGVAVPSPMLTKGIILWVPASPSPLGRGLVKFRPHRPGWGRATHSRGQPGAKEQGTLEAPRAPAL